MPTGYTAAIKDGISFPDFTLKCARAFGALVMMRDEPEGADIPDEFQPSDYHINELIVLGQRKKELTEMALIDGAAAKAAEEEYQESITHWEKREAEKLELRNKYNEMLAQVVKWKAPTSEHEGLKEFMIKQLRDSIDWDCSESEKPEKVSTEKWYIGECARVQSMVSYHTKENEAEINRAAERSKWVRELKESLNELAVS
jgi:hypothetical protein